jgi:hypothetical protein
MSALSQAIAYRWAMNNTDHPVSTFILDRKEPSKRMQHLACEWWRARSRMKQEILRGKKFHPCVLKSYHLNQVATIQDIYEYKY